MVVSKSEREYLRNLARKQQELSFLPCMEGRDRMWTLHNDAAGEKPLVTVEVRTFIKDLLPELVCQDEIARIIELKLLSTVCGYEYTKDDRVVSDYYSIVPETEFYPFSIRQEKHRSDKEKENQVAFVVEPAITDLERQIESLGPSEYRLDQKKLEAESELCQDLFGDILPLKIQCPPLGYYLSKTVMELIGMEEMLYAFYDYPDELKLLIEKVDREYHRYFDYLEDSGLLQSDNENALVKMGTVGYTSQLPDREALAGKKVLTKHIWGHLNSQETVSISPETFQEFFGDYYIKTASRFGLCTYGCCEPVHRCWDGCLDRMPDNLRKVSISAWCDEAFMGERLRGTSKIYHRKPSAEFLGVGKELQEDKLREYIKATLVSARGCKVEFSFRDVYTLNGNRDKVGRAVEIVRECIERYW
ncbi:MAG: hypothetical protein KH366_15770 [Clostridiaceae bacterium]|nr:hypothetical protein [Clostridiaceae bacterium]